jgi:hypothetical protein
MPVRSAMLAALLALCWTAAPSRASPWAEVGDAQLRSDIEILAAAGVIDNITSQWPIPWKGILTRLSRADALDGQPSYVVQAAHRVEQMGHAQVSEGGIRAQASVDATNRPDVVRAFDALGREDAQGQMSAEAIFDTTAIRLSVGAQTTNKKDHQTLLLDGSYLAQEVGGAVVTVGYLTHWWGPGWISALQLSNNARPFPQVGIERLDTAPFRSPWLSWIGPWQMEFFAGWLNGPRVARNTLYDGLRVSFNPLPGLEIDLARTDELCGEGHPCKPLATYFDFQNSTDHPSRTNDEGTIDLRYAGMVGRHPFSLYTQMMNEDTNPLWHSGSSHLVGGTIWFPLSDTPLRLTAEYTDSIATHDIFSFGRDFYGFTYNDYKYPDGMRYRDSTLGFSLDSDSRLATLQASWSSNANWTYTLAYHRADIGAAQTPPGANILTKVPTDIDIGEARVGLPLFSVMRLDIEGRIQDEQLPPKKGFAAAIETALTVRL